MADEIIIPEQLRKQLSTNIAPKEFQNPLPVTIPALQKRLQESNVVPTVPMEKFQAALNRIKPEATVALTEEAKASVQALRPNVRRLHGTRIALSWFPFPTVVSPCADKFGYLSSQAVRTASALPFNPANLALLAQLGDLMGDAGRDPNPSNQLPGPGVTPIPAGYTYFGQFVDHDITLDVSSSLDAATDANTINNMRSAALDLDSLYGGGPGLDPFMYAFPTGLLPATAIKLRLGGPNLQSGPGGPSSNGTPSGMTIKTDWDVPRLAPDNTAVIGDPRNDENLIVSQFHHAMIRFHNAVIDLMVVAFPSSPGVDLFAEAKKIVTHHYQFAVVNDFLKRVCGAAAVGNALGSVVAPIGSAFRMPVEFSVAAYRFGHSMIRDRYWLNFNFTNQPLSDAFAFIRNPHLPARSNWLIDFNAFFDTGIPVPVNNKARKIDSFLANGLESLPGFTGMMAVLAARNLRRGLALGLPSGQAMATVFGITPLTSAQLTSGLPVAEVALLNSNGGVLLTKTPLWYYILREAAVVENGDRLGPLGAKIVADTFVRMLKRDATSYLNVAGGFSPSLPTLASTVPGDFTVADLVAFAGVTKP